MLPAWGRGATPTSAASAATTPSRAELDAIADALGDEPCKADASAFGFLAVTMKSPLPTPVFRYARSKPTLVAYVDRAPERFFADQA